MGFQKHGTGEVLRDEDNKKTASTKDWSEGDEKGLVQENDEADKANGDEQ